MLLLIATALGQSAAGENSETAAQAKLAYHGRLDDALKMPVMLAPDGEHFVYFARAMVDVDGEERLQHEYRLADIDGRNERALFQSPIEWDDCLNAVTTSAMFSTDGKRMAVATTDNGRAMRDRENPGRTVPAVLELSDAGDSVTGEPKKIPCERGSCGGFGFVRNDLLVLDTPGLLSGEGYRLVLHGKETLGEENEGDEPRVIHSDEKLAASCLRISSSGDHAVFFVSRHVGSSIVRLRFVELSTGQIHDSPEFRSQNATFDGPPQLFWDTAGDGVYCHVSTQQRSKWPFELTHYNFRTGKGVVAAPMRNIGASCTLGEGLLALWHPDANGCSVLDVADGTLYRLPDHNYILGGRGRHVAVADLERGAVYAATITLRRQASSPPADER